MVPQRRHFETFDALRFLAFFSVFLQHLPVPENSPFEFISNSGTTGVRFFFVLSGFLISYILLFEKQTSSSIKLKNFFVRRILRIWPLFYAMILFAFMTPILLQIVGLQSSNDGYDPDWLLSSLFLENYKMMFSHNFPNVSPLIVMWSLCVEEHFYIIWGLLVCYLPQKHFPKLILSALLIATISRIIYANYNLSFLDLPTNMDFFAFGAIPAYLVIIREKWILNIETIPSWIKYALTFFTITYSFTSPNISFPYQEFIEPIILGIMFMLVLLFTLPRNNRLFISESNILSRLGLYTYGLYLFHIIIINLLLQLLKPIGFERNNSVHFILFALFALMMTIIASYLSYHFFERKFLSFKKYFSARTTSGFADSDLNKYKS